MVTKKRGTYFAIFLLTISLIIGATGFVSSLQEDCYPVTDESDCDLPYQYESGQCCVELCSDDSVPTFDSCSGSYTVESGECVYPDEVVLDPLLSFFSLITGRATDDPVNCDSWTTQLDCQNNNCYWNDTSYSASCASFGESYCNSYPGCTPSYSCPECSGCTVSSDWTMLPGTDVCADTVPPYGTEIYHCSSDCSLTSTYCSDVKVCYNSKCVVPCIDPDVDNNPLKNQTAVQIYESQTYTDSCSSDGDTLTEYSCSQGGLDNNTYSCSTQFGAGYVCQNGACLFNPECLSEDDCGTEEYCLHGSCIYYGDDDILELSDALKDSCTDNEPEKSVFDFGTIDYVYQGEEDTWSDQCSSRDGEFLWEIYCNSEGYPAGRIYDCVDEGGVCHGGVCAWCTDTDNGNNPLDSKGTVEGSAKNGEFTRGDYCDGTDAKFVYEYSCNLNDDDGFTKSKHDCTNLGSDYLCESGKCVLPDPADYECYDPDEGTNEYYNQTSVLIYGSPSNEDTCLPDDTLGEFYCTETSGPSQKVYDCPSGECSNGACLRAKCGQCTSDSDCASGLTCAQVIGNPNEYQCVNDSTGACANGETSSCEEPEDTTKCADSNTVKTCSNNVWGDPTIDCPCSGGQCNYDPNLLWAEEGGRELSEVEEGTFVQLYIQNYEENDLSLPIYYDGSNLKSTVTGSISGSNTIGEWTTSLPEGYDDVIYNFEATISGTTYDSPDLNVTSPLGRCGDGDIQTELGEECDEELNNAYTCSYDSCASECTYCHADTCQIETVSNPNAPRCGDGNCNCGETGSSCPEDCDCGNGVCEGDETESTCPADCDCGDGDCEGGEEYSNCPADCPEPADPYVYWATESGNEITNSITLNADSLSGNKYRLYLRDTDSTEASFSINENDGFLNSDDYLDTLYNEQGISDGFYVTWTTSYSDFQETDDVSGGEDPFEFYFETDGLTSGYLEIFVNGDIPECNDGECNGDETPETCPEDCEIDPCEGKTLCSDYTPEGQAVCEADACNLSAATVPGEPGPYETEVCYWTEESTCEGKTIVGDEDGIIIGECLYSESETEDDCSDGFYTYSWTTQWQWDESNRFIDNSSIDPWYWDSAIGRYRKDNPAARQNCNAGSGQEVIPCPAQIQLDFFNTKNLIAAILLILVGYLIIQNNKNRNKNKQPAKKKSIKKKPTKKKVTTKKPTKKKVTSKKKTATKKKTSPKKSTSKKVTKKTSKKKK